MHHLMDYLEDESTEVFVPLVQVDRDSMTDLKYLVTDLDCLIALDSWSNVFKLTGNYVDRISSMISRTLEAANHMKLKLFVFIPKDNDIDITLKVSEALDTEDIYSIIDQIEAVEKINDGEESISSGESVMSQDVLIGKFNDCNVPVNFRLLRKITVDLLKKEENVNIHFEEICGELKVQPNFIVLSKNMDFVLADVEFWTIKNSEFHRLDRETLDNFSGLKDLSCSQKTKLLQLIKKTKFGQEKALIRSQVIDAIAKARKRTGPLIHVAFGKSSDEVPSPLGDIKVFLETVMISKETIEIYITTISKILVRLFWNSENSKTLVLKYIDENMMESINLLFENNKHYEIIDKATVSPFDNPKYTCLSPHDKLMWICFGKKTIMKDNFQKSKSYIDIIVIWIMAQNKLIDISTHNKIFFCIFQHAICSPNADIQWARRPLEILSIYQNLYNIVAQLMETLKIEKTTEYTLNKAKFMEIYNQEIDSDEMEQQFHVKFRIFKECNEQAI